MIGFGAGIVIPASIGSLMGTMPLEHTGSARQPTARSSTSEARSGVAIVGSTLSTRYQRQLAAALAFRHVPAAVHATILGSLGGALAVADRVGGVAGAMLAATARAAFVSGMDVGLQIAAGVACAGVLVALIVLPLRTNLSLSSAARRSSASAPARDPCVTPHPADLITPLHVPKGERMSPRITAMPGIARSTALALDDEDPLASFRERFVFEDELIYLDGNSLGRLPKQTLTRATDFVAREWGARLIRGWGDGWMALPVTVGDQLGEAVLGPRPVRSSSPTRRRSASTSSAAPRSTSGPDATRSSPTSTTSPPTGMCSRGIAQARGLKIVWVRSDPHGGPSPEGVAPLIGSRTALVTLARPTCRRRSPIWPRSTGSRTTPERSRCGISVTRPARSRPRSTPMEPTSPSGVPTNTSTEDLVRRRSCTCGPGSRSSFVSRSGDGSAVGTASTWNRAMSRRPARSRFSRALLPRSRSSACRRVSG